MSDKISAKIITFKRYPDKCRHSNFIVDASLQEVECEKCGEKLNPMYVIEQIAMQESRLRQELIELQKQVEKTRNKMKCKCEHCKKMTKIQR